VHPEQFRAPDRDRALAHDLTRTLDHLRAVVRNVALDPWDGWPVAGCLSPAVGSATVRHPPTRVDRVARVYTVEQAQQTLRSLRPLVEDLIVVRADATELGMAIHQGVPSPLGGLPELKAAQARLDELVSALLAEDVQLKGIAPVLLDFPAEVDGLPVLLCWLEGDPDLGWYHRADLGFAARRPLGAP